MTALARNLRRVLDVWELAGAVWVQGSYGWLVGPAQPVTWAHRGARGYCLAGAIELVGAAQLLERDQIRAIYHALIFTLDLDPSDGFAVEHWNDEPGRSYDDVRHAIEAAIELERIPAGVL